MRNSRLIRFIAVLIAVPLAAACQQQPEAPAVQNDSGVQPRMAAITVEGCLKSGTLADNTWVLLGRTTEALPSDSASTYELVGADSAALREQQNTLVRVAGTHETDRRVTTSTGMTAEDDEVSGTAGTPEVGATATVDLRRLRVDSVTPTGTECD